MAKYKKISKNIQQIIIDNPKTDNKGLTWLNINNASKQEIEYLRKNYNFELPHLHSSLASATAQRPIVNKGQNYLFLILHFPIFINNNIIPGEIDFFVGHGYLITLHNGNIDTLNDFFNISKKDVNSLLSYKFESSAILLYEILEKLILACYPMLDKNSIAINQVEDIIFAQEQKKSVAQILSLRHNIINFRKIMQNHKDTIKKLMQMESTIVPPDQIKKYYLDLIEHTKRIWEILENQKEMVEVLNNTNESLLNFRISDIMKTLTIFSVIVFPLTLVAGIFGMNVTRGMPLIEMKHGFWIIIAIMIFGSLGMLWFFERKRWL